MAELHEPLRRDLAALRQRADPPPGAEQRVLASIEAAGFDLGSEPELIEATELGAPVRETLAPLAWSAKVVAITLALAGVGILAVRGSVLAARALAPPPSPRPTVAEPATPATLVPSPERPPERVGPPSPASMATPASTPPSPSPAPTNPAAVVPRPSRSDSSGPEPASPDSLAAELALVESARAADPAAALELLEHHAQRFPAGALATERELLIVESLCALGRLDQARARAGTFARTHPASPQLTKLRTVCPELARP